MWWNEKRKNNILLKLFKSFGENQVLLQKYCCAILWKRTCQTVCKLVSAKHPADNKVIEQKTLKICDSKCCARFIQLKDI